MQASSQTELVLILTPNRMEFCRHGVKQSDGVWLTYVCISLIASYPSYCNIS
jgi:hypothetical protein